MSIHKVENKSIIYQKILKDSLSQDNPKEYYDKMLIENKFTSFQISELEKRFKEEYIEMLKAYFEKVIEVKNKKNNWLNNLMCAISKRVSNILKKFKGD